MAKKEETPNMVEQFAEFKELKNIDKATVTTLIVTDVSHVLSVVFFVT